MIPYRTKRLLTQLLATFLVLILVTVGVALVWFIWLSRYVVFTRDGVKLDFSLSGEFAPGVAPVPPGTVPTVNIHFNEENQQPEQTGQLTRFSGYTVTAQELIDDFSTVSQQLLALPEGSTVALQVKDIEGYFFYDSSLGRQHWQVEISKMEELISALREKGHYLIARMAAFQDKYYFLDDEKAHVPFGLAKDGGNGSLWKDTKYEDGKSCYWFNPDSEGTVSYLIQLILELRLKGFDEVLLEDFRFPNTSMIRFDGDQQKALDEAAATLVKACATDTFTLSFGCRDTKLTLPEGRVRLYLQNAAAADIVVLAGQVTLADPAAQLGFLTELHDTRFDEYCVLRPLSAAQE